MNEIEVDAKHITLRIRDPNDWIIAERLTGSALAVGPGVFTYATGALNLQRIYSVFSGPKRPVLKGSSFFMDRERVKMAEYQLALERVDRINSVERLPLEPNGLFVPYAHQTRIVGVLKQNPYPPIAADCGLGKTGSSARAIEQMLEIGDIAKGKTLISAPLSILGTSWMDDIKKFTRLKACVLREKRSNKNLLHGDEVVLMRYGPKTGDMVTVKTRRKMFYRHLETGRVVDHMDTLLRAEGPWEKFSAKCKVGINLNGEETPIGEVLGKRTSKEETKKNSIRELLADSSYDLYLINHDGVKLYKDILKEHRFAWVIVDESTEIKSPASKVHKAHVEISWLAKRRSILTGTPNPNGFLDLWGQFYFLDRGLTLEATMRDYLAEYFRPVSVGNFMVPDGRGGTKGAVKWVIRSLTDRDRLIARVRRAGIFLKQRDCIDLPPRTDMRREVSMTDEQERAYLEMERELMTEFLDGKTAERIRAEAVNVLAKMMKLRQITSGFMAGSDGGLGSFKTNPKLEDLDLFLNELGDNKLVVACQFREEIRTLLERYKDLGITSIDGSVKLEDRDARIRDFQNTEKYRAIVLQPAAAGHGITLTASSYLFFLSLDYNFEYYYQVAKRIERIGQKNNIFVIHSLATLADGGETIDHDLMDVLAEKNKDRDLLFDNRETPNVVAAIADRMIKRINSRV